MKILQITPHFSPNIGGVETHIDDLASALVEKKHKVFVLTYRPLQTKASWKMFEQTKDIEVLRIPWIPGLFYKFVNIPILEFLYLFPGIFLIAPVVILYFRPKVLHAHGLVGGAIAAFWGKVFKIRSVISTHNIYNFPSSGLHRKIVEWIFQEVDSVLCLSALSADEIKKIVKNKEKISVFTSWVDLKKFRPLNKVSSKQKLGWTKSFIILFVGRLVSEKGIDELLKASKLFRKEIKLKIAGSGPLKSKVMKYYIGEISQNDLPLYYSASDLVVVPSTHEEGFGRVILESLACGTPVVGAKRGAIPSVMNKTVGKLIDVTPENIKAAVEDYYMNPKALLKASKNAKSFAESRYSSANAKVIIKSYLSTE